MDSIKFLRRVIKKLHPNLNTNIRITEEAFENCGREHLSISFNNYRFTYSQRNTVKITDITLWQKEKLYY